MNINFNVNINNIYRRWFNSLPAVKNNTKQKTSTLNHSDEASVSASSKGNVLTSIDKVLYSGEVVKSDICNLSGMLMTMSEIFPSSQRDYTIEDAINYQYNKQFTIKIEDLMNGNYENIKLRDPNAPIPQEFIDSLKQNGITETSYDTSRTQFYLNGLNEDIVEYSHSVDYLASGYAVAKQHIMDGFSGEEKANALERLEKDYTSAITQLADKAAKELGGFLDENGADGETQKIYDSIINSYNDSVRKYSNYIKKNNDYANLDGTENEWLKKDTSYMACQVRKAINTEETAQTKESEDKYYSIAELDKTKDMIAEIKSDSGKINWYDDEEKIGYQLAEMSLKSEVYAEFSGVSESLKNAVCQSVDNIVSGMTDKLNEQLEKVRKGLAEPEKLADFNKDDVLAVYDKVMKTYKNTGDMVKALQEGAAFGRNRHMKKTKISQYASLNRYGNDGSRFWRNFYQNTVKYKTSMDFLVGMPHPNDGYLDKESGIETLTREWNSFVAKFTDDNSVKIGTNNFLAYA